LIPRIHLFIWLKGVKIGKKVHFIGVTTFYRKPESRILIANNCQFLSLSTSNLIGINRPCILSTLMKKSEIIIGNNCGFSGTVIASFVQIKIGNNVLCGANTLITDSDWHLDDFRSGIPQPITIEDNVWIGEGVKVLKGVTIGENSMIGAGSVVIKSIPKNVIAAGNPCRVIKELDSIKTKYC
jgi:acetyltransferase-like isoleucine patch superfamily enzyme